ncbi:cytochrome P450 [Coprinopsis sp. MPI-PUGE-AT-0042]|nr:cytochrome P450 [Coprinopsis sp. MPI-PUGE-AT-0042]
MSSTIASLDVSVLLAVVLSTGTKSKGKKPPGPRGLPLVGNAKYGPIVGINLGGKNTIILNTNKVASDLLDKRASIYSDRPRFIVAQEMMCGGLLLVFTRYGEITTTPSKRRRPPCSSTGILKTPDAWDDHLKRTAASQIMAMVYDTLPIKNHEEPLITRVNDLVQRLVKAAYPGEHMVEFFPWLNKLPNILTPWKDYAAYWHRKDSELFMDYYKGVKDRVLAGDERPSLVSSLVKRRNENKFTDREASWVAGVMVSAGAETTAAVMAWFFLAMTTNPEVQRKAQEEIDNVVGHDRMPDFKDYESMPYVRAIVREILRWRPVDPIGLQHQSTEDDVYEGYFIPKGTLVIFNVWAMNRDPELDQLKPTHPHSKGEGHFTYGFGRRICVGRYVANNTLFIDIAHILWACTIEPARNHDGSLVQYNDHANLKEGLVVRPAPFRTVIKPRFPAAAKIVAEQKERLISAASIR